MDYYVITYYNSSNVFIIDKDYFANKNKKLPGTREKVRSKRINLEGNAHAQEINVSLLPV
jgi:hypothetical protein